MGIICEGCYNVDLDTMEYPVNDNLMVQGT